MKKNHCLFSCAIAVISLFILFSCVERPGFDINESIEELNAKMIADTNEVIGHYNLGLKYLSVRNYDSALIEFYKSIDINYQFALGHFAIYCTELAKDPKLEDEQKNDSLEKIRKNKLELVKSHFNKAVYYDPFFDWTTYTVILDDISQMDYEEKIVYQILESGIRSYILGNYKDAKKKLTQTYEDYKNYYRVLYFRGLAYAKTKEYNDAITDFHTLIEKKEERNTKKVLPVYLETADYYYIIGYISLKQDSLDKAEKYFKKALMEDMSMYMAHFHLSYIYQKRGKLLDAINELDAAVLLDPKDPVMIYNKGAFLMGQNKLEAAIDCFKKSVEINPRMNKAYFNLALIYEAKGNKSLAVENFRNFIKYSPIKQMDYIKQAQNKISLLSN